MRVASCAATRDKRPSQADSSPPSLITPCSLLPLRSPTRWTVWWTKGAMPGSGPTWWHSVGTSSCPRRRQPKAMSPHPAHPPSPPLLRPRLRGSDGPSCSLASTTCCRCSVPPASVKCGSSPSSPTLVSCGPSSDTCPFPSIRPRSLRPGARRRPSSSPTIRPRPGTPRTIPNQGATRSIRASPETTAPGAPDPPRSRGSAAACGPPAHPRPPRSHDLIRPGPPRSHPPQPDPHHPTPRSRPPETPHHLAFVNRPTPVGFPIHR